MKLIRSLFLTQYRLKYYIWLRIDLHRKDLR